MAVKEVNQAVLVGADVSKGRDAENMPFEIADAVAERGRRVRLVAVEVDVQAFEIRGGGDEVFEMGRFVQGPGALGRHEVAEIVEIVVVVFFAERRDVQLEGPQIAYGHLGFAEGLQILRGGLLEETPVHVTGSQRLEFNSSSARSEKECP